MSGPPDIHRIQQCRSMTARGPGPRLWEIGAKRSDPACQSRIHDEMAACPTRAGDCLEVTSSDTQQTQPTTALQFESGSGIAGSGPVADAHAEWITRLVARLEGASSDIDRRAAPSVERARHTSTRAAPTGPNLVCRCRVQRALQLVPGLRQSAGRRRAAQCRIRPVLKRVQLLSPLSEIRSIRDREGHRYPGWCSPGRPPGDTRQRPAMSARRSPGPGLDSRGNCPAEARYEADQGSAIDAAVVGPADAPRRSR